MKKNIYLISGICMLMAVEMLAGCGNEGTKSEEAMPEAIVEEAKVTVEPVEISEDDIKQLLARDIEHEVEIKTHEVSITDDTNSEDGKYDLMDKVNVSISFTDELGLIQQNVNKDVYFMRDVASGKWEATKENCKKWDTKFKQLGGTSWKMTTDEGDIYFRLRDTIEFFSTQPDKIADKVEETRFSTTILGAMYVNVEGEPVLKRIHVMSGILSENGDIILHIEYPLLDEEGMDIDLSKCERIEREDLPFTEEEYKITSDQR